MEKIDFRKKYKHLYQPRANQVQVVDVPELQFAMIDGVIEPDHRPGDSPSFRNATMALYGVAYTLKFSSKMDKDNQLDYKVMTLEALWWVNEGVFDFSKPGNWGWRALFMQPEHITQAMFADAVQTLKKKQDNPALDAVRLEPFSEGPCIQMMHVGPYADEPATLAKMADFAAENGYVYRGKHHEIYLGDPRLAKPENLKTVLRQPVEKIA